MAEAYTGHDRIGIYLSGGASNGSPAAALGGAMSGRLVRGMTPRYINPVAGVVIEDATPENGPGVGSITITDGVAVYTPPDGAAGAGVTMAEGERKVLTGADVAKAVRVYRAPGHLFTGTTTFGLVDVLNGVLAMGNVADAVRAAGGVHYRGFFVKALADSTNIRLWVTTTGQASFALATETPVADAIQAIANQTTAPTGRTWVAAVDSASALVAGNLAAGASMGIWVRRTFPAAGTVALNELVQLHLQHRGL